MARVRDYMHEGLVSAGADITVADAARIMQEHGIGCLLVMNGDRAAGVFTERDVLRAVAEQADAPLTKIGDWMTPDPVTISPDAPTMEAIGVMLQGHFRHLPVAEGDRVIGILSMRDLLSLEPARRSSD